MWPSIGEPYQRLIVFQWDSIKSEWIKYYYVLMNLNRISTSFYQERSETEFIKRWGTIYFSWEIFGFARGVSENIFSFLLFFLTYFLTYWFVSWEQKKTCQGFQLKAIYSPTELIVNPLCVYVCGGRCSPHYDTSWVILSHNWVVISPNYCWQVFKEFQLILII